MVGKIITITLTVLSFLSLWANDFDSEYQRVERWIQEKYPAGSASFQMQNNRLQQIRQLNDTDARKIEKLRLLFPQVFLAKWELELQVAKAQGITFSDDNKTLIRCPENVTQVIIPSCVTTIGDRAFANCRNLTSVRIPDSVTLIGNSAFYHCGLTSVNIPNSVTYIGALAFFNSYLIRVNIPSSVTYIGEKAFSTLRGLINITIPHSVTLIGDGAFASVKSVKVADNHPVFKVDQHGALLDLQRNKILYLPPAFRGRYVIPDGITHIGTWAFIDRKGLTEIVIPRSVTTIGEFAFARCDKLTNLVIPYGVTTIKCGAFSECTNLIRISLANSVKVIDSEAFEMCQNLDHINIPLDASMIGAGAFRGIKSVRVADNHSVFKVDRHGALLDLRRNKILYLPPAFRGRYVIPDGVTHIESWAFASCSNLTSVTIPTSVTNIGFGAFYDCRSLTNVNIPSSVTLIQRVAFDGCERLTSISIPHNTRIEDRAFPESCRVIRR